MKILGIQIGKNTDKRYLEEQDIRNHGFVETLKRSHFIYYKKGKMSLKWDFHVEHRIVTIKWGKALRFFGNVETKQEFDKIMKTITKYFG